MILQVGDWVVDIDLERTMQYYAEESAQRCDCAYCRNFSSAVDLKYPQLRPFLAQFGVDIDTPDESMPYDRPGEIWYENVYSVCGNVLKGENGIRNIDTVAVEISSENIQQIPSSAPEPHFFLNVGMIMLPWVLEEPLEETLSPANEPSFLEKMRDKLLSKIRGDRFTS